MIKKTINVFMGILFLAGVVRADGYNFITAQELDKRIKQGPPVILVDICPVDQFAKGIFPDRLKLMPTRLRPMMKKHV
jgi:hypothetical protein